MSLQPEKIDELLSSMLDGVLNDAERLQLENAIQQDPSLEDRLDELAALRKSLLSGRRVGRLGPDFAKNVTRLARSRAAEMGVDAPVWLASEPATVAAGVKKVPVVDKLSDGDNSLPTIAELDRPARIWIPALVLVTAAVVAIIMMNVRPTNNKDLAENPTVVGQVPGMASSDATSKEVLEHATAQVSSSAPSASAPSMPSVSPQPSKFDHVASKGSTPSVLNSDVEDTSSTRSVDGSRESKSRPAEATDALLAKSEEAPKSADAKLNEGMTSALAENKTSSGADATGTVAKGPYQFPADIQFTYYAEVTMTDDAIDREAVRELLDRHRIVFTDDLAITDAQLQTLVDSRLIKATQAESTNVQDGVNVFFLKGRALQLGAFTMDLMANYQDFPKFTQNMLADKVVDELVRQLSDVRSVADDQYARRIVYKASAGQEMVSLFPATGDDNPRLKWMNADKRKAFKSPPPMPTEPIGTDMNPMSNMLLIVRKAE